MKRSSTLIMGFISLIILFGAYVFFTPIQGKQTNYSFQTWTNDSFEGEDWIQYGVEYNTTTSHGSTIDKGSGNILFRLVYIEESLVAYTMEGVQDPMMGQGQVRQTFPQGLQIRERGDWAYSFTVIIPNFLEFVSRYNNRPNGGRMIIEENRMEWEVYHLCYRQIVGGKTVMWAHWILDKDTKAALSMEMWSINEGMNTTLSYTYQKSSVYIGREFHDALTYTTYALPILIPSIVFIIILLKVFKKEEKRIEEDEKRRKSKEYKEQYIKKYEQERESLYRGQ